MPMLQGINPCQTAYATAKRVQGDRSYYLYLDIASLIMSDEKMQNWTQVFAEKSYLKYLDILFIVL
jgi:hypothetical protein